MINPEHGNEEEAQQETGELGRQTNQGMPSLHRTGRDVKFRGLNLQDEDSDDDSQNTITERLNSGSSPI